MMKVENEIKPGADASSSRKKHGCVVKCVPSENDTVVTASAAPYVQPGGSKKQSHDVYVERYRELYAARFGKEITMEEATEQANKLLVFFNWLYQPMSRDDYDAMFVMAALNISLTKERKEEQV